MNIYIYITYCIYNLGELQVAVSNRIGSLSNGFQLLLGRGCVGPQCVALKTMIQTLQHHIDC